MEKGNKKYYIEFEGKLNPLKKWMLENHQHINGYVYNELDITHTIENKLKQLGWNSIYDELNHWQILTLRIEFKSQNTTAINQMSVKPSKNDSIGKIIIENGILNKEKFRTHTKRLEDSFDLDWLEDQRDFLHDEIIHFEIEKINFEKKGDYNRIVREKIKSNKLGCYILSTPANEEILYIGMAGKLKTNGEYSKHSIASRLQAPRTKDSVTKKEINTEEYLKHLLDIINEDRLRITVLTVKNDIPSGYLEAILLYQFYKKHGVLPLLNSAF